MTLMFDNTEKLCEVNVDLTCHMQLWAIWPVSMMQAQQCHLPLQHPQLVSLQVDQSSSVQDELYFLRFPKPMNHWRDAREAQGIRGKEAS